MAVRVEPTPSDREEESHATIRSMLAERFDTHDEVRREDHIVRLENATWADYRRLLELRGERSVPRLAYLDGAIELMSPSRMHEVIASWIGHLIEVWCDEHGIECSALRSWTLKNEEEERGAEADECYVFGDNAFEALRPQLAIEVIWTSGRLDKREIYRSLGVQELWFWRRGVITIFVLRGQTYEECSSSEVLPGIDVAELASFLDRPAMTRAQRDYRAALRARLGK